MAKAKKQESEAKGAEKPGGAKAKPAGGRKSAKAGGDAPPAGAGEASASAKGKGKAASGGKPAPGGAGGVPLIDTSLAAATAATMVANRGGAASTAPGSAPAAPATAGQQSSTFKQLKQGLTNKPATGIGNLLGNQQTQKKPGPNFGGGPNFRNQTTGGFNKTGVPRRTSG